MRRCGFEDALSARPKPNGEAMTRVPTQDEAQTYFRLFVGDGRSMEYKGTRLGAGAYGTRDADKQKPHESKTRIDSRRCMPVVVSIRTPELEAGHAANNRSLGPEVVQQESPRRGRQQKRAVEGR